MSCMTITAFLLLSCLGATCTSLGVKKEPTQEGVVRAAPPVLPITEVRWLLTGTSTTVQICTVEDLPAGLPTLYYDDGTGNPVTLEGVIDEVNPKCANFPRAVPFTYTENPSRYELIVTDTSDPPSFLGRGVTTFAITVRTTLLTCGGSQITKLTWSAEEKIMGIDCLEQPASLSKACYHDEDLTGTEFCLTVNDEGGNNVNVCLNGPLDASSSPGTVSTNYFYYGDGAVNNVPADATLSLVMYTAGLIQLRAIVRLADDPTSPGTPGKATVHECTGTECTFVAYTRKFAKYEVCVDAMDENLETVETATTAFTDLNLHAFDVGSQKSTLLESVFANGLENMNYKASLYQEAPPDIVVGTHLNTENLNCSSAQAGQPCFGFLDTGPGVDIVYLALSAMDGSNTIIVPFAIPVSSGLSGE